MRRIPIIAAIVLGLTVASAPAWADVTYTLKDYASSGGTLLTTGDFGTVNLHQNGPNDVVVTVSLSSWAQSFANSSAGYAIAWDLSVADPTNVKVTINSGTQGYHAGPPPTYPFNIDSYKKHAYKDSPFTSGSSGGDPHGNYYDFAIDYTGATSGGEKTLVFDVSDTSGLLVSNFVGNANHYLFGVDILASSLSPRSGTFVVAVPEPKTVTLFLAGLLGLGLFGFRRRTKA